MLQGHKGPWPLTLQHHVIGKDTLWTGHQPRFACRFRSTPCISFWWENQRRPREREPSFYAEQSLLLTAAPPQCSFILNAQSLAWPCRVQNRAQINRFAAWFCKRTRHRLLDAVVLLYSEKLYTFICKSSQEENFSFLFKEKKGPAPVFVIEANLKAANTVLQVIITF